MKSSFRIVIIICAPKILSFRNCVLLLNVSDFLVYFIFFIIEERKKSHQHLTLEHHSKKTRFTESMRVFSFFTCDSAFDGKFPDNRKFLTFQHDQWDAKKQEVTASKTDKTFQEFSLVSLFVLLVYWYAPWNGDNSETETEEFLLGNDKGDKVIGGRKGIRTQPRGY